MDEFLPQGIERELKGDYYEKKGSGDHSTRGN
jgi:hypothetical protein